MHERVLLRVDLRYEMESAQSSVRTYDGSSALLGFGEIWGADG